MRILQGLLYTDSEHEMLLAEHTSARFSIVNNPVISGSLRSSCMMNYYLYDHYSHRDLAMGKILGDSKTYSTHPSGEQNTCW